MELNLKALGRRIRHYRKLKGWKQRQLAEVIDVTDEYISHIENAHARPSLDKMVAIANALEVDMNTLLIDSLTAAKGQVVNQQLSELISELETGKLELVADFCRSLDKYEISYIGRGDADERQR